MRHRWIVPFVLTTAACGGAQDHPAHVNPPPPEPTVQAPEEAAPEPSEAAPESEPEAPAPEAEAPATE